MAQGVGEHERVEPVVLDGSHFVTLPRPRGDARRYREHRVPGGLQMLYQQALGAFDRNGQPVTEAVEVPVELSQAADVMGNAQLQQTFAVGCDHAQLVVLTTPVDPGEHRPLGRRRKLFPHASSFEVAASPSWPTSLDAHSGAPAA